MKKAGFFLLAISVLLSSLSGCAGKGNEAPVAETAPPVVDSPKPAETEPQPAQDPYDDSAGIEIEIEVEGDGGGTGVDVDLTALSSTMVYAEVFNIMTEPESYVGKSIKMRGQYYANYYEPTQQYYHFVVISDATACCAQGLEFVWLGEHAYPGDYPEAETEIEVTGVFSRCEEDGQTYYCIEADSVKGL